MLPSSSEEVEMGATSPSIRSTDSPRALQKYGRLALAAVLALLAWSAFRNEYGYIPLLSDIDLAIHEFGHMLFMPFGIQFLGDRKSTRLNSSHGYISYAVFCLKKKNK